MIKLSHAMSRVKNLRLHRVQDLKPSPDPSTGIPRQPGRRCPLPPVFHLAMVTAILAGLLTSQRNPGCLAVLSTILTALLGETVGCDPYTTMSRPDTMCREMWMIMDILATDATITYRSVQPLHGVIPTTDVSTKRRGTGLEEKNGMQLNESENENSRLRSVFPHGPD
ncbi:F-box domain cyclin-containing protein [Neofusicoccum parvum]|uniref:F-box domain cyclin-containing protein n=1 Tax=Neofusicoccum parvum TaxID=310453 RepID=A0ACB5RY18_9PEZI|nr:F-box domain cyclin-containing protein [Neofusicoccum parvum]